MTATELLNEGRLDDALAAQAEAVAADPADPAKRLLLCDLLLFDGDLDAVRRQLDALAGDQRLADYVETYRQLCDAEEKRRHALEWGEPSGLGGLPKHVRQRWRAVERLREGRVEEAVEALDRADAAAPGIAGHVDGREFDGLRDGDDRFGPVLEAFVNGEYVWLPAEEIRRLRPAPAETPRDLLYVPARLTTRDGAEGEIFLPALYPGSSANPSEAIRLGRESDWLSVEGGPVIGVGLRLLHVGEEELSLWEIRQLDVRVT